MIGFEEKWEEPKFRQRKSFLDFIFPRINLALEVKLYNDQTKKIIDEMYADIQSYDQIYERILFIIYDLGAIRNEVEFKTGIDDGNKTSVMIVKNRN